MAISSRTPEGQPNVCPVCGSAVCIEPSLPLGEAPCPCCGTLLWFAGAGSERRVFDREQPGLVELVAERLGVSPEAVRAGRWEELMLDSLDLVELIMELEEDRDLGPGA